MSVKRKELIKYLEVNGFYLLREGGNHSIYTNDIKTLPVKRHRTIDRITAKRMSEKFLDGIFCHSERNEVERRIPIFRYGWRCNTWLLLRWA
ncbi:type II toxin-antitoxin system HicA family toxin [Nostoc sp.]|uniref:type II toxin-antitoxin system HicA family toxin n=1 Tax=Nostoc sp. TaxID=1180 RepID=UPI002FFAB17E